MAEITVCCPGKAILTGEHAAVYSKTVIAATVDLYLTVKASSTEDMLFKVNIIDLDYSFSCKIADMEYLHQHGGENLKHPGDVESLVLELASMGKLVVPKNTQLAGAIFVSLYLYSSIIPLEFSQNGNGRGIELNVQSSIPLGSGLGSSASYSAAVSTALLFISRKFTMSTPIAKIRELADFWAFKAEQVVHGTPSGVDNATVINGGFVKYSKGSPLVLFESASESLQFLVVDTRIPKNTKTMVANVAKDYKNDKPGVRAAIDAIDDISIKFYNTLQHLDTNNAEDEISKLLSQNQEYLRFLGVSHESLDNIVRIAENCGLSAKLTGGGGGGCALVFIPHSKLATIETVSEKIEAFGYKVYRAKMGVSGLKVEYLHPLSQSEFQSLS